jgi:lysyl-tRNA synthetase class 2
MANDELNVQQQKAEFNEQVTLRRQKLAELQAQGKDPFDVYKVNRTHTSREIKEGFETLEGQTVTVAGRLMSKRVQGKAGFSHIQDRYGRLQMYIKIDDVGEERLKEYKSFDLGDWISVTGFVFKTKTEEITVHVKDFQLISKSLKPLPTSSFHHRQCSLTSYYPGMNTLDVLQLYQACPT